MCPDRFRARRTFFIVVASFAFVVASFVTAGRARAQTPAAPQPAMPLTEPAGPPVAAAPTAMPAPPLAEPHEDVLRRILRSGCHDGLAEARALAINGSAPWAATITRLCGEVLQHPVVRTVRGERNGRGTMVVWSTIYGFWTGVAFDVLFEINGVRSAIVPPLVGMGAGLGLSLALTAEHPITNGEAWTIATGLEFGSFNGALWAGGSNLDSQGVVGASFATGLAAGAAGLLVARAVSPTQGDVEVVRSGLLWGTVAGMLTTAVVDPSVSSKSFFRASAVAMDLGFLGGLALAASYNVSRNRDLIIDAGTLGGAVAGGGIALLVTGTNVSGRTVAAGTLAGLAVGMLASIYFTDDMDDDDEERTPPMAALVGRDGRGRWRVGTPGPVPVLDGLGRRVVGATFTALGGTF